MRTDWNLIREMIAVVIDSFEQIEAAGYTEQHRDLMIDVAENRNVSVYELMVSAWTLPEKLRYRIIRDRHDKGADLPYIPEAARALVRMAEASAELIGGRETRPAAAELESVIQWYRAHVAHVQSAIATADTAAD
jgi:hypothetical protein